jgi:prephenate dehydrogenase
MFKRLIAAMLAALSLAYVAGHALAGTDANGFEQRSRQTQDYNQ